MLLDLISKRKEIVSQMRSSTNYLLKKDDVGKSKPSVRTLPHAGHTFGYKEKTDAVGVGGCKLLTCKLAANCLN